MKEQVFDVGLNKKVAALVNKPRQDDQEITLLLHGWLDNAASFSPIIPLLDDLYIVAIDLQGHGKSSHRPEATDYNLVDYVQDVYQLISTQSWSKINIIGHSLGGIVGAMFSACFPELVARFVCIETAGPLTESEDTTVLQLRESIISRVKSYDAIVKQPASLKHIVASRMRVSDLSEQNASIIMQRNIEYSEDKTTLSWRTDHRLRTKSSIRLTEEQACDVIENIACPTLMILGTKGFKKVSVNYEKRRSLYPRLKQTIVEGGHYVHMDSPEETARHILLFLVQK